MLRMETLEELAQATEQLRALADVAKRRDELIAQARIDGHRWDDIAESAGMSVQSARIAGQRGNGGKLPQPGGASLKPGARIRGV